MTRIPPGQKFVRFLLRRILERPEERLTGDVQELAKLDNASLFKRLVEKDRTDPAWHARIVELEEQWGRWKNRRPKPRTEDDWAARATFDAGMELKRQNPRITEEQIAANLYVSRSTWQRIKRRLKDLLG